MSSITNNTVTSNSDIFAQLEQELAQLQQALQAEEQQIQQRATPQTQPQQQQQQQQPQTDQYQDPTTQSTGTQSCHGGGIQLPASNSDTTQQAQSPGDTSTSQPMDISNGYTSNSTSPNTSTASSTPSTSNSSTANGTQSASDTSSTSDSTTNGSNYNLALSMIKASTADGGTDADRQAVAKELSKLPTQVLQFMKSSGMNVETGPGFAANVSPDLAGQATRGHASSDNWYNLPGTSEGKTLIIGTKDDGKGGRTVNTDNEGAYNLVLHELGHMINYTGQYGSSTGSSFLQAYNADEPKMESYYQQPNGAGADEAWAESFDRYMAGDPTLAQDWPNLYNWMKQNLPAPGSTSTSGS